MTTLTGHRVITDGDAAPGPRPHSSDPLAALENGVTLVTGTDTDVGKTVATAVLAAALVRRGRTPHLVKPVQTGLARGADGDVQLAGRLAAIPADRLHEYARLPEPLAPATAARRAGVVLPSVDLVVARLNELVGDSDPVLVEGAGGILVGLDDAGRGLLELADALANHGIRARFVVVARSGLGTLNHTALTCAAIRSRGHEVAGLIIGAWPARPGPAERCNLAEIESLAGAPLLACLPDGIGADPALVARAAQEVSP